jgi:SagB-type dehydrogenase family enzyme
MEWHNQPNPFRFYEGAPLVTLPLSIAGSGRSYGELFAPPRNSAPLNIETLSRMLRFALGLSAWKQAGSQRWPLRMNPSSGNLHPTEGYAILPALSGVAGGLYHYDPFRHALERRAAVTEELWRPIEKCMGGPGFLVGLTSIYWREAWKYGERAFRYCHLDAGHALAALSLAARLNGWRLTPLTDLDDARGSALLGLDRAVWPTPEDAERFDLLAWVSCAAAGESVPLTLPEALTAPLAQLPLLGRPNRLSAQATRWSIIYETDAAGHKPATDQPRPKLAPPAWHYPPPEDLSAEAIIRRRRSAQDYDPSRTIAAQQFFAILERTLPYADSAPFESAPLWPGVNILFFVHRVEDVEPGLYFWERSAEQAALLREISRADFPWKPAHETLPLWRLHTGDVTLESLELCCHQEIAGYGAFAAAMIAPFLPVIEATPFYYRHLYWECGMIGQVLYLEAEAQGLRGTGIGCFFDDPTHELLGLPDDRFQSLYHFTIGHAMEDARLTTLPGYDHLKSNK